MDALDLLELERSMAAQQGMALPAWKLGISAAALFEKHFEPMKYAVKGLLAEGVTVLAGAPKIGKSWFALDLALAVANGHHLFGTLPVNQGDVLYLALEDNQRRLRERLNRKGLSSAPECLTFVNSWPDLRSGCIDELDVWATEVDKPSLIIIGVVKMVRGYAGTARNPYDEDYHAIAPIADFARMRGIPIILVHHVRKQMADDPLESVSGTNGLTGAADTVMVLKRDNGTGNCTLYVRGRDIEESERIVRFSSENCSWELLGDPREFGRTEERENILQVLKDAGAPLAPREVAKLAGRNDDAVRQLMHRMSQDGEIKKTARGRYTCHTGHNVTEPLESDIVTDVTGHAQ